MYVIVRNSVAHYPLVLLFNLKALRLRQANRDGCAQIRIIR